MKLWRVFFSKHVIFAVSVESNNKLEVAMNYFLYKISKKAIILLDKQLKECLK